MFCSSILFFKWFKGHCCLPFLGYLKVFLVLNNWDIFKVFVVFSGKFWCFSFGLLLMDKNSFFQHLFQVFFLVV